MLPPTRAALLPHIIHANYVTMQDKSHLKTVQSCRQLKRMDGIYLRADVIFQ